MAVKKTDAKCLLVCAHYKPLIGGALAVYDALARCAPQKIQILTACVDYTSGFEVEGWRAFDAGAPYRVNRIARLRTQLTSNQPHLFARILNKIDDLILRRRVWRSIERIAAHNQITHICIGSLDALGWLSAKIAEHPALKSILYVHGEEVTQKAYSAHADDARKQAFQNADAIVVVSSFTANAVTALYGLPSEKITCITNGVDLDSFQAKTDSDRPVENLPAGRFVFACGRLVARKGFDQLVEAWPKVIAACPDIKLLIGGAGPIEAALKHRITALELSDSIIMLGRVDQQDLPAFYRQAQVFASPNRTMPDGDTEGFGLVFLEAAATGTPAVGGNAGGVPDAIIDGNTGILVDGTNQEAIADALIRLLSDNTYLTAMSQAALTHAQTQSWQSKTDTFIQLLEQV